MFDLHCTAPESIKLSSKGLISQKLSYGQEYLIVVDPFKHYLNDHVYTITIDDQVLMSDNTTLLRGTIMPGEHGHNAPVLAKLLNKYYYWDRTVLHVKLTEFKNEDTGSGFGPITISNLKSMDGVMDKMYRNELLPKHMRLTKEERDRKVPFNIITRSEHIAMTSFKKLSGLIPVVIENCEGLENLDREGDTADDYTIRYEDEKGERIGVDIDPDSITADIV